MGDDYEITYSGGSTVGGHISTATHPTTTVTIGGIDYDDSVTFSNMTDTGSEFTYNVPDTFALQDFVHSMPELSRVESMCEQYPALNKVYEQFKLIYKMTVQDYEGKLKERNIK
tara:strand:+ start:1730 stop:2071 length:342 start_codon:yes stop_codon:yes gene_type:complete